MQWPLAPLAWAPRRARLAVALLMAGGAAAVEVAPAAVATRLRRAAASGPADGHPGSLAQVEQQTLAAQQQALEAAVVQEERLEAAQLRLEAKERQLTQRLDRLQYLEQAWGLLVQVRQKAHQIDLTAQLISAGVYVVFILMVTALYSWVFSYEHPELQLTPEERVLQESHGFAWNLCYGFNCDPDWRICLFSCFAMPVRWADTASNPKVSFVGFWLGLAIFTLSYAFSSLTYGATSVVLLVIVVQNRQKIRMTYGLNHGDFTTRLEDCCIWMFCPVCATMQEAMEVEFIDPPRMKGVRRLKDGK